MPNKCALCQRNEPNKTNTHYLTDSVIRYCLNQPGKSARSAGSYFNISNDQPFIDYSFQQDTSPEKITDILGREPSDEEIEKAKNNIEFSVDFIFCTECENKFTEIENKFTSKYLQILRSNTFNNSTVVKDYKIIKSFFLLQVWRTSVCDDTFIIPETISEKLRLIILNNESVFENELAEFPLCITYLSCEPGIKQTGNIVGLTNDRNPNVILMCDFIIQFFDSEKSIRYFDFYSLNDPINYSEYLNLEPAKGFIFRIFSPAQTEEFNLKLSYGESGMHYLPTYKEGFRELWKLKYGKYPEERLVNSYIEYITKDCTKNKLHFSVENISKLTNDFFENIQT